jgi:hypothetical protein
MNSRCRRCRGGGSSAGSCTMVSAAGIGPEERVQRGAAAGAGRSASRSYLLYQPGKDYEIYEDYINAADRFRQALRVTHSEHAFRHDLVVRAIFTLKKAQLHEEAIQLAEAEMANWQHSPDFFFALGVLQQRLTRPGKTAVGPGWTRCTHSCEPDFPRPGSGGILFNPVKVDRPLLERDAAHGRQVGRVQQRYYLDVLAASRIGSHVFFSGHS